MLGIRSVGDIKIKTCRSIPLLMLLLLLCGAASCVRVCVCASIYMLYMPSDIMIIIIKFLSQSRVHYIALYDKSTNVELYAIATVLFTVHRPPSFVFV